MNTDREIGQRATALADDLLHGVKPIADEIGEDIRRTYRLLAGNSIPAGKLGGQWVASRRVLREHYDALCRGKR